MIYFKDTTDGSIHALEEHDKEFIKDTWVEIDESEVDTKLAPTPKEYEDARVHNIDMECKNIIYTRYSMEKQTNVLLGMYNKKYKDTMIAFIENIRNQCKELKADVTKTKDDYIIPEGE